MKTILKHKLLISTIALLLALIGFLFYRPHTSVEHPHFHAGFIVYIDGVKQNYSNPRYMNYTPCSEHNEKKSPVEEQIEKAHLHEQVGDVVHVHRDGAVWGDLFKNIEVKFDQKVGGYIDGTWFDDVLSEPIRPYQTLTVVIGDKKPEYQTERVSREHIEEVEAKSELCGTS